MSDRNYTVYKHTSPSGKVYIGITGIEPEKRWRKGWGYNHNTYFINAVKKYGWDNIKHEIIDTNLTKEEAELKRAIYEDSEDVWRTFHSRLQSRKQEEGEYGKETPSSATRQLHHPCGLYQRRPHIPVGMRHH